MLLRKAFIVILACLMVWATTATAQTRRRSPSKTSARAAKAAADKTAADMKLGRDALTAQIKTLSRFLYLLGGVVKSIEAVDQASRGSDTSAVVMQQNERNKTKIRDSLRNVREGLDKLETDFRTSPTLKNSYSYVAGIARRSEVAENQAAANRFDEAGRTLLDVVGQLTDALAALH